MLAERERATGAQMVVAIFPSLEGEPLEDVSIRLAERWRVGQKGLDNGVIALVFVRDRKVRLEVGYGLEGAIPDAIAGQIIRDRMGPAFREGRYAAGLEGAINAVFARIDATPAPERARRRGPAIGATQLALLFVVAVIAIMALAAARRARGRSPSAYTYSRGAWGPPVMVPPVVWGGGGWGGARRRRPRRRLLAGRGKLRRGRRERGLVVRHHPAWTRALFAEGDLEAIAQAVTEAEAGTSAEIRVHLERRAPQPAGGTRPDALQRAREVFAQIGMHRTALRHGVLIYLALEDHQVAIVGDEGIHARLGDAYWAGLRDLMVDRLRRDAAGAAIVDAVRSLGPSLARHFPRLPGDTNELSDSVSLS